LQAQLLDQAEGVERNHTTPRRATAKAAERRGRRPDAALDFAVLSATAAST
jgi:hypothetical protein